MSDEFPFTGTSTSSTEEDLPLYTEYAWDFNTDCFIYDDSGNNVLVEGNEAVKVWIYKALKTERFRYTAYSWQYGIELKKFIGKVMTAGERISEFKRVITECLMVNPYIKSINSITITQEGTQMNCEIDLTTIYAGATFATESGIQFTATETADIEETGQINIEAVTEGDIGNVDAETINVISMSIPGIDSVINPEPTTGGYDEETDEELLERYLYKVRNPITSGNKNHYE